MGGYSMVEWSCLCMSRGEYVDSRLCVGVVVPEVLGSTSSRFLQFRGGEGVGGYGVWVGSICTLSCFASMRLANVSASLALACVMDMTTSANCVASWLGILLCAKCVCLQGLAFVQLLSSCVLG